MEVLIKEDAHFRKQVYRVQAQQRCVPEPSVN